MVATTRAEPVSFYSQGVRVAATMMLPAEPDATPYAAVVQGPGWLGLRDAKLYRPYHDALLAAGIAVLVVDYRGFGDSEGDATYLDPRAQVEDIRNAVTYIETRDDIDPTRIGAFGSGGTGGGNAIMAAGLDERIRATVAQTPISDGRDWLRRMRSEHEWLSFLASLREDRAARVVTGQGRVVAARDGIAIPTPERRTTAVKADVDARIPAQIALASADAILEYRPLDFVGRITPRATMIICVEGDATTPEDHSFALYDHAGGPKRLVVQRGTTHYAAYAQYRDIVAPMIADWYKAHLSTGPVAVHDSGASDRVTYVG